jgi:hypothetical protein
MPDPNEMKLGEAKPSEARFNESKPNESATNEDRRSFLMGAAGVIGAVGLASAALSSSAAAQQTGAESSDSLRQEMMNGVEDDVKGDLTLRSQATEELPKPANLRPNAMLDGRFPVYFETSVSEATRLMTAYFAAATRRDLAAVARTLHFPYATYEGVEPLIYATQQEFLASPPPMMVESSKADSKLRPGTYDILDNLQVHTFNPVNVGMELSFTRYRADGYRIGICQGIYAVTNNDGKWGIQLSSVIFTPTEYIGQKYNDAIEAHIREGRTSMARYGERAWDLFPGQGNNRGNGTRAENPRPPRVTASITGAPGATSFFLSGWAGKPMEAYNSKGRLSRLAVTGPRAAQINAMQGSPSAIAQADRKIDPSNISTSAGKDGWFYEMAGGDVAHYGYTMTLAESKVLHAGPEKAHALGGYIRYTNDHIFISETRSLEIMLFDLRTGTWSGGGMLGQSMRRDRSNDASPGVGSV